MIHGRRPHAPCRGAACRSRRCTNDWNNVPLKRHAPIASVAALSERHAHPRITERPRRPHAPCRGAACRSRRCTGVISGPSIKRGWPPPICHCEEAAGRRGALSAKREEVPLGCNLGEALPNCTGHCRGAACRSRRNAADSNGPPLKWQRLPDLSLRGRFAPVAISGRQLRFRRGFPVIHPGTARFPRRFAPRNGNSDSLAPPNHHCNTRNCRRRSLSAATDAIGWYVLIGSLQTASAFPRLPRPRWGLAMTRQGSARCTSALLRFNFPVQGAHSP